MNHVSNAKEHRFMARVVLFFHSDRRKGTDATFTSSFDEITTNIWNPGGASQTMTEPLLGMPDSPWFISLLPAGTDTGVLHQLALRINSSLTCNVVPVASFPTPCPGPNHFEAYYSNTANYGDTDYNTSELFSFRVSAADDPEASFVQGDRDRQDISEYTYLDLSYPTANLTYRCGLDTTAGYFELPNYWNNYTAGEILALWPPEKFYQSEYFKQDISGNGTQGTPSHQPPSARNLARRDGNQDLGPMVMSAMAIFGGGTFFNKISSANDTGSAGAQLCSQLRRPFMGLFPATLDPALPSFTDPELPCEQYKNGFLAQSLLDWLNLILTPSNLDKVLRATTTSASKTLTQPDWHGGSRVIYTSAGTDIVKLHMPSGAMILISFLIALQLTGLLSMAIYASTRPTWTESLDGFAMLRFGAAMASELPSISALEAKHIAILDEKKGWIGHQKSGNTLKTLSIGGSMRPKHDELYRLVDAEKRVRLYVRTQKAGGVKKIKIYRG
jgi:hypothetical protein